MANIPNPLHPTKKTTQKNQNTPLIILEKIPHIVGPNGLFGRDNASDNMFMMI